MGDVGRMDKGHKRPLSWTGWVPEALEQLWHTNPMLSLLSPLEKLRGYCRKRTYNLLRQDDVRGEKDFIPKKGAKGLGMISHRRLGRDFTML